MSKSKTLLKTMGQIVSALWKLCMLALYLFSRIAEGLAKVLAKISEKFIQ